MSERSRQAAARTLEIAETEVRAEWHAERAERMRLLDEVSNGTASPEAFAHLFMSHARNHLERLIGAYALSLQLDLIGADIDIEEELRQFARWQSVIAGESLSFHNATDIARAFHEEYEKAAPLFGYETRKESAKPWSEVPAENRVLMIHTVIAVFARLGVALPEKEE